MILMCLCELVFYVSSRRRHTICALVTGVQTCALPISTHHSIEDIAWLRVIDRLAVIVPADPWETAEAIKAAAAYDGPVYVRISRMPVPELARARTRFAIGQGETLREGGDIAIVANGPLVRSEEHTSELQSLMRISYAVFCLQTN